MSPAPFDYAPLLPSGLPAPAARWTGLAKYSFVGGNNDPDGVPVEGLVDAVTAVLKRGGKSLATYTLAHGATMKPTRSAGAIDFENEPIWMTLPVLLMA
jgi:2-aminoadipate transaminase